MQIVDQEYERRVLREERGQRFEHLDLVEVSSRCVEAELGEDPREGGRHVQFDPASASRSAAASGTYGRWRSSFRAARASDSHTVEPSSDLVEQPRLADPCLSLDLGKRDAAAKSPLHRLSEGVESTLRPSRRVVEPPAGSTDRLIGLGRSGRTSSWRRITPSTARVSGVGSSPSSSSSSARNARYRARASCCRPRA